MSARERILAKLRAGNRPNFALTAEAAPIATPEVAPWYAAHRPTESTAEKAKRFRHFIELAHAEVHSVTPDNWLDTLYGVLRARQLDRLLLAEGTPHGDTALDDLLPRGIECSLYDLPIEAWKTELFNHTPAALTAARAAIAETGTLILWPDDKEPRLMSLVPPVHIVLLDATKIYNTFFEAMTAENWADTQTHSLPTNALLISGPSKTADIQQTLAYGAHGPKELIVLMLESPEAAQ